MASQIFSYFCNMDNELIFRQAQSCETLLCTLNAQAARLRHDRTAGCSPDAHSGVYDLNTMDQLPN